MNKESGAPPAPVEVMAIAKSTRKYTPRITGKKKSALIVQKEAELRDARNLQRLISEAEKLSPWGRTQLFEALNKLEAEPKLL